MSEHSHSSPSYNYDPDSKYVTVRGAATFPQELFRIAGSIEFLDMRHGNLSSLPENFGDFKNLKVALFSHNDFDEIPPVLAACHNLSVLAFQACKLKKIPENSLPLNLRGLSLANNKLRRLPASVGDLTQLQKLVLTDNELEALPDRLIECQELTLLRIQVNRLASLPSLFDLPMLSWYTDTANLFSARPVRSDQFIQHDAVQPDYDTILGQNGRNVIYGGTYKEMPAAIKRYGATLKTDVLSHNEIAVSLLAGVHDNIIGSFGAIDDRSGGPTLVMPLVPSDYSSLGNPPSFESLVRDTFPEAPSVTTRFALKATSGVAKALQHLHSRGIMHGDVYAHNILINPSGHSILGDFGDASVYDKGSDFGRREKIDIRGFGYFVDDLVSIGDPSEDWQQLLEIRDMCLRAKPSERPTFDEVVQILG
jgi:hypothetical protein